MVKHEKLLKEENEIKEKLQNEVTKIKEKLEYFWSKSNNEIKKNEKINQGITKLKNEENNNNININKILSYISNIWLNDAILYSSTSIGIATFLFSFNIWMHKMTLSPTFKLGLGGSHL